MTSSMEEGSISSPVFDAATWAPLLELSSHEVFEIMLGTRLHRFADPADAADGEFTALVGLAGSLCGVLSIRCSSHAARSIAGKMLGMPPEQVDNDSFDALGEVANMIAGNFKSKLSGAGNHCMLSVPTIIVGSDYEARPVGNGNMLHAIFEFDDQPLWVTLELNE